MTHRLRIAYAGTPEFAVPALNALQDDGHEIVAVYTRPDRPAGRGQSVTASPVKRRALELGLPLEQPATLRSPGAAEQLRALGADLMVVAAYGLILPPEVLAVPRLGCWNIHASLLPRWRGAAPIQRAILAGDTQTGITIMQMDAGLDTGPMLLATATHIGQRETAGELHDRLATLGAEVIVAALREWQAGRLTPRQQPVEGVSYAAKIRKDESLIDWTSPACAIDRQVRAFNPWPVAETRWEGRQLRVWSAEPVAGDASGMPGQVIEASGGRLVVVTGDGALSLTRVQLAGRRTVTAAEFLNAHALAGACLG
jgi:methionyl-tRNA formyltransferase